MFLKVIIKKEINKLRYDTKKFPKRKLSQQPLLKKSQKLVRLIVNNKTLVIKLIKLSATQKG